MGRPKKILDEDAIYKAGQLGVSFRKLAQQMGVTHKTITNNYREIYEQGEADGDLAIANKLWELGVEQGNAQVLLRMAEHRLGLTQKVHQTTENKSFNIVITGHDIEESQSEDIGPAGTTPLLEESGEA